MKNVMTQAADWLIQIWQLLKVNNFQIFKKWQLKASDNLKF